MKILRTPDSCFEGLADYPFAPHYTTIKTADGSDLRIHHLDEGDTDAVSYTHLTLPTTVFV